MSGLTKLDRARNHTLVYLAVLSEPGASLTRISNITTLTKDIVLGAVRDLETEELVASRYSGSERRVYAVPQPDPKASATLHALLHKTTTSRADILAEA